MTSSDLEALEAERDDLRRRIAAQLRSGPSTVSATSQAELRSAQDRLADIERRIAQLRGEG
jgi:transcription elongation GreA/GreB family factor